jgi:hypothetical protein
VEPTPFSGAECVCLCSKGGVFPVQQVLVSPWRKSVSAGGDVQRVLQPYASADQDFVHEGQRPYASADQASPLCWAAVIPQDPTGEPDLTPDSPRSRTPKSRNRNYLARSLGVVLSSSTILANFFNTVCVIGPVMTSPGKTSRLVLVIFLLFVISCIGALFYYFYVSFLGRVEERKDPEDLPWIRTA